MQCSHLAAEYRFTRGCCDADLSSAHEGSPIWVAFAARVDAIHELSFSMLALVTVLMRVWINSVTGLTRVACMCSAGACVPRADFIHAGHGHRLAYGHGTDPILRLLHVRYLIVLV